MTTDVIVPRWTGMDLTTAAVRRLLASTAFATIEDLIGTDAPGSDPWVFQGLDAEGRPFRDPEGSGKCVLVLSSRSEWSGPNRHNTFEFPRLQVLIYADSTRNDDGTPALRDAERKIKRIQRAVDVCFHLAGWEGVDTFWQDGLMHDPDEHADVPHQEGCWVHSSLRSNPVSITDVPSTQSLTLRAEMLYDVGTD